MRPAPQVAGLTAYKVPEPSAPIDLDLRGNEGARPCPSLFATLRGRGELLRSYPDASALEAVLAGRFGVATPRVMVTAGADDGLDRVCRAVLSAGREAVVPSPAFEMTLRYIGLSGAAAVSVPWDGPDFPRDAVLEAVGPDTALVALTTPNNPTGTVIDVDDLTAVARAVDCVVLVDLAYVEYADADPTAALLELPNVVVLRTFSKARGLAGLRVGYAIGPEPVIRWMRAAGAPYAVAAPSLALAAVALQTPPSRHVDAVRAERAAIRTRLEDLGVPALPSGANFVFARTPRAAWLADGLAGLGIGVRSFPRRRGLADAVRIACPGSDEALGRLLDGLGAVLEPEALLFDMDGVLVDVRESYRAAITGTAAHFGVRVDAAAVAEAKRGGDANNDWVLTRRLLAERGVDVALDEVVGVFEALYQGGLWRREEGLFDPAFLSALAQRLPLAVVTGRPRPDAERALQHFGIADLFDAVVCMGDAAAKPDPAPVRRALAELGVRRAWMVGDTPDDVRAARGAGVVPLGVCAPGEDEAAPVLRRAGASRVLARLEMLLEVL